MKRFGIALLAATTGAALAVACSSFSDSTETGDDAGPDASPAPIEAGCAYADTSCIVLAQGEQSPGEIVADESFVAWVSGSGTSTSYVRAVPATGGAVTSIAGPENDLHSLHLDGDQFYFATGVAVRYGAKNAGPDAGTTGAVPILADASVSAAVKTNNQFVFLRGQLLSHCAVPTGMYGCATATAATDETLDSSGVLIAAEPKGQNVWFAVTTGIAQRPTTNLMANTNYWKPIPDVTALAVDGSRVFFVIKGESQVYAKLQSDKSNDRTLLAAIAGAPHSIAVDDTDVYVTLPDAKEIVRIPLQTPQAQIFAHGLPARGIAVTQSRVIVTTGAGDVVSFAK